MYRVVPPHIYISLCVLGWGLVASFQCLATSFGGLLVLRALLGITEAAFGPGVPFYLSLFYRRHELAFRNGLFISAAPLATSFASSLAYLIVKFSSNGPISPWRTLFLVEGFPSVIVAVFAWFLIPDSPGRARFLNRRQRVVAQQRLEENTIDYQQSYGSRFNWREILNTAADPKAYMAAVSAFDICNAGRLSNKLTIVHVLQLQRGFQFDACVFAHNYQRVRSARHISNISSLLTSSTAWDIPHCKPRLFQHLPTSSPSSSSSSLHTPRTATAPEVHI